MTALIDQNDLQNFKTDKHSVMRSACDILPHTDGQTQKKILHELCLHWKNLVFA
jgi:hypothetical protein